jgi:hypothetical protein
MVGCHETPESNVICGAAKAHNIGCPLFFALERPYHVSKHEVDLALESLATLRFLSGELRFGNKHNRKQSGAIGRQSGAHKPTNKPVAAVQVMCGAVAIYAA